MEIQPADIESELTKREGAEQQLQQDLPQASARRSLRELLEESSCRSLRELLEEPISPPLPAQTVQRKSGGWKAVTYIIGNSMLQKLATYALSANLMVYFTDELHLSLVSATNIINIYVGLTGFAPRLGAFVSDSYVGRFRTIVFSSFILLMGMGMLTVTAWMQTLHPQPCSPDQLKLGQCVTPSKSHMAFLLLSLGFISLGSGGNLPCSVPFGVDQLDSTTEKGRRGMKSFFNIYFATITVVFFIIVTPLVYIQDKVSWTVGFGISTLLMACSVVLLLIGKNVYVHVKPQGSMFTSILQVLVAARRKRHLQLPDDDVRENDGSIFYDPLMDRLLMIKLPLTSQITSLNKAALIEGNDLKSDGSPKNRWRLCSVQQVEELKCLIKVIPIWVASTIMYTVMPKGTFIVSQALKVDRHLGMFEIPAGSLFVINLLTVGIFLPIYDRLLVPAVTKITKVEGGISVLQRIGIGSVFSVLAMVVAGIIEKYRREMSKVYPQDPVSFLLLAPQLILLGFVDAFSIPGMIEFFNQEFPVGIRSVGFSLLAGSASLASLLRSVLVNVVHRFTTTKGKPDWLTNDINSGRLDLLYHLFAGIAFLNFIYFLFISRRYHYTLVHRGDNVELGARGSNARN